MLLRPAHDLARRQDPLVCKARAMICRVPLRLDVAPPPVNAAGGGKTGPPSELGIQNWVLAPSLVGGQDLGEVVTEGKQNAVVEPPSARCISKAHEGHP